MPTDPIRQALKSVVDPELGVNIVDLGLVYRAAWTAEGIDVAITMTTPTCPLGEMLVAEADETLRRRFPDAARIDVALVWDPPWSAELMNDDARRQLGWTRDNRSAPRFFGTRAAVPGASRWRL